MHEIIIFYQIKTIQIAPKGKYSSVDKVLVEKKNPDLNRLKGSTSPKSCNADVMNREK